jgi:hypothetical protein
MRSVLPCILASAALLLCALPAQARLSSDAGSPSSSGSSSAERVALTHLTLASEEQWFDHVWRTLTPARPTRSTAKHASVAQASLSPHSSIQLSSVAAVPVPATVRHRSRAAVIVDNPAPSSVPPARLVAPISDIGDGAHWSVSLVLGRSNSSGQAVPDSSSLPVHLVLDTGSADMMIFNKTTCIAPGSGACTNNVRSASFTPSTVVALSRFGVTVDGEGLDFSFPGRAGTMGTDLVTFATNLLGTNQVEYFLEEVFMFVSDNFVQGMVANPYNGDQYGLVNRDYYDRADGSVRGI